MINVCYLPQTRVVRTLEKESEEEEMEKTLLGRTKVTFRQTSRGSI
jgi:hypothetical protein